MEDHLRDNSCSESVVEIRKSSGFTPPQDKFGDPSDIEYVR